jgi:hypothetical protein
MTSRPRCIDRNEQNEAVLHRICYNALYMQSLPGAFRNALLPGRLLLPVILGFVKADTNSSDQR